MISAVLFDLDGTLANVSHLSEYILGHNTDYDTFHKLADDAKPIDWVVWELERWYKTHDIIIVTARQEKFRKSSEQWLGRYGIPFDHLWMRPLGDLRPDYDVKRTILRQIQATHRIEMAYDDNPSTIKLWLENNIPTLVVPGWPAKELA